MNLQWKSHWVHANPSEKGKHRIKHKGGKYVYQKKINDEWHDQPEAKLELNARWS